MSRAAKSKPAGAPESGPRPIQAFTRREAAVLVRSIEAAIGMPEKEVEVLGNYFSAWYQWLEQVDGTAEVSSNEIDALHCVMDGLRGRIELLRQLPHTKARLLELATEEGS